MKRFGLGQGIALKRSAPLGRTATYEPGFFVLESPRMLSAARQTCRAMSA